MKDRTIVQIIAVLATCVLVALACYIAFGMLHDSHNTGLSQAQFESVAEKNAGQGTTPSRSKSNHETKNSKNSQENLPNDDETGNPDLIPSREHLLQLSPVMWFEEPLSGGKIRRHSPGDHIEFERKNGTQCTWRFGFSQIVEPRSKTERKEILVKGVLGMTFKNEKLDRQFRPTKIDVRYSLENGSVKERRLTEEFRTIEFQMDQFESDPPLPWTFSVGVGDFVRTFIFVKKKPAVIRKRVWIYPHPNASLEQEESMLEVYVKYKHDFMGFQDYELSAYAGDLEIKITSPELRPDGDEYIPINPSEFPELAGKKRLKERGYRIRCAINRKWEGKNVRFVVTMIDLRGKRFTYESKVDW